MLTLAVLRRGLLGLLVDLRRFLDADLFPSNGRPSESWQQPQLTTDRCWTHGGQELLVAQLEVLILVDRSDDVHQLLLAEAHAHPLERIPQLRRVDRPLSATVILLLFQKNATQMVGR